MTSGLPPGDQGVLPGLPNKSVTLLVSSFCSVVVGPNAVPVAVTLDLVTHVRTRVFF